MSWSGGKDSAYALHQIMLGGLYDVRYLVSTIDGNSKRISIHEVPESLIEEQAFLIGIPLLKIYLHDQSNEAYKNQMGAMLSRVKNEGIYHIIFGDLFLQDLRNYREEMMNRFGMQCVFPLWQMDSLFVVQDFIAKGFRSIICSVNETWLSQSWVGRAIDEASVADLPASVDPCGENGEYHSFCYDGPVFQHRIAIKSGLVSSKSFELKLSGVDGIASVTTTTLWYIHLSQINALRRIECGRCGTSFECNAADVINCQCNAVVITSTQQDLIKNNYADCLCANCLQQLAGVQLSN